MRRSLDPLLLIALALLAVSPALLGRPFYTGDLLLYFYPFRYTLAAGLAEGRLLDWDPATGCGMPFCADPQAICYDPAAAFYALLDLPAALGAEVGLRLAMMGLGTWLFLRGRGVPAGSALLGAVPAALGGVTISLIGRLDKIGTLALLPWVFVGVDQVRSGRRGGLLLLVGAFALGGLPGGLEVQAMALGGALLWAAFAPALPGPSRTARSTFGYSVLAFALSLALTAALWLPFGHLISASSRGGGLPLSEAGRMSAHPAALLGLVLPELFNDPSALTNRLHPGAPAELWYMEVIAPGWIVLLLAARALVSPDAARRRAARLLGALSLGAVVLALGLHTPIYGLLFEHVPGFALWRYPGKFLIPLGFSLPAMAGLGAADPLDPRTGRAFVWGALSLAVAGALVAGPLSPPLAELGRTMAGSGEAADWTAWTGGAGLGLGLHALALAGGVALLAWRPGAGTARAAALVLAADLLLVHLDINPPGPPELVAPSAAARVLPPGTRVEAYSAGRGAPVFLLGKDELETALAGFRMSLYPDLGKLDGLEHADSVRAIRPAGPVRFFGAVEDSPDPTDYLRFLEIAGVEAVVSTRAREDEVLSAWPGARPHASSTLARVHLWRLTGSAPRVYRTERARSYPDASAAIAALAAGEDPRVLALVGGRTTTDSGAAQGGAGWQDGQVELLSEGAGHLHARVEGELPGWLVVLQAWDRGWRARVDGQPAEVLVAQGAFLAVPVPAGAREVTLHYEAPYQRAGVVISLLTILGLAAATAWRRRIHRV